MLAANGELREEFPDGIHQMTRREGVILHPQQQKRGDQLTEFGGYIGRKPPASPGTVVVEIANIGLSLLHNRLDIVQLVDEVTRKGCADHQSLDGRVGVAGVANIEQTSWDWKNSEDLLIHPSDFVMRCAKLV